MLKEHVWDELAPRLTVTSPTGAEKYEFAAKVALWQGAEPRRVADLLLRAAWCCVDEGDMEAERYFRRQSAWIFERALSSYDGVERDERAVLTYLVGELWRRVGDTVKARRMVQRCRRGSDESGINSGSWTRRSSRRMPAGVVRLKRTERSAGSEHAVAGVAQPRQDVAGAVQLAVERCADDGYIRVRACHPLDPSRCGNEAEKSDPRCTGALE